MAHRVDSRPINRFRINRSSQAYDRSICFIEQRPAPSLCVLAERTWLPVGGCILPTVVQGTSLHLPPNRPDADGSGKDSQGEDHSADSLPELGNSALLLSPHE